MPTTTPLNLQKINYVGSKNSNICLRMARLDQINQFASGNKIYKLRPIIAYAKANNYKQILSFGGAFSNHIHALALLAQKQQISSIGLIRGEPEYAQNPTLSEAQTAGMRLVFINRTEYKRRNDPQYLQNLQQRYPDALIIPEGGSSQLAIQGCAQMARDIDLACSNDTNNILAVACGTGATAAGLACGLTGNQQLNVYSVLKDDTLKSRIDAFINAEQLGMKKPNYSLYQADFGGYAKFDKPLLAFIMNWLEQTGILLDPIYTSKMCRYVIQQIEAGEFSLDQSITLIHSGGLQGWRGMQQRVETLGGLNTWKRIEDYLENGSIP